MEKLICASCNTTETTEYRRESNWNLCWICHKSWLEEMVFLEIDEDFNDETLAN